MNISTITAKTVFYIGHINYIGGVETWIYSIAKKYSENYDITTIYKWSAPEQIKRLKKLIRCIKYTNENIECDNFVFCYDTSIIDKVKAKEYILTIHADYKAQNIKITIPKQTTKVYAVSELAKQSFIETHGDQLKALGLECEVLYNPIMLDEPKKVLKLISATRLTKEKGGERMKMMAKRMHDKGIPFIWLVFTNSPIQTNIEEFVFMKPKLDILGYIKDADYLIQLSDTEGFAYSLVESLCLGIPVVVTEFPVAEEMGIKYGKNGYVLKFDMSNLDEIIEKMYTTNLKGFDYKIKESNDEYEKILGEKCTPSYNYKEELKMKYLVEALDTYEVLGKQDAVLGRIPKTGEQFEVTKERLDVLLGENAYNTPFVKVIKAIEFEKKDILEEHIEKQEKEKPIENPKKKTTKKTKKDK